MDPEPLARRGVVDAVTRRAAALDALAHHGVVPVLTVEQSSDAVDVSAALVAGGLPVVEITLRTAAGLPAISDVCASFPEIVVGAGTVLDVDLAAAAVDAGARFVVSPVFDDRVVAWCRAHDVLVLPGVTTPNEMMRARRAGLDVVKFFPAASAGGIATLRAVSAVFDELRYVPTGGIRAADLEEYLRIPTVVACGGSWMVDRSVLAARDWAVVESLARDAVEIARRARTRRAADPDA
jgi:2-dehydro-3-deoxyphosphogluconate aldolase / (4S)-4-hydroxy-2-oxoglutarate aldolase